MRFAAVALVSVVAVPCYAIPTTFDFDLPGYSITMAYDVRAVRIMPDLSEFWILREGIATGTSLDAIFDGELQILFGAFHPCTIVDFPCDSPRWIAHEILIGPIGTWPIDGNPIFLSNVNADGQPDLRTGLLVTKVLGDSTERFAFSAVGENHVGSRIGSEFQWWGVFEFEALRTAEPGVFALLLAGGLGLSRLRRARR